MHKISGENMLKTDFSMGETLSESAMREEDYLFHEIRKEMLKLKIKSAIKKRLLCSTSHIEHAT